jgi:hypothetical protein
MGYNRYIAGWYGEVFFKFSKIEELKCSASSPPLVGVTTGPRLVLEHALARGDTTGLKGRGCCCCDC